MTSASILGGIAGPDLSRAPVRLVLDDLLAILRQAGWTDHKTIQLGGAV